MPKTFYVGGPICREEHYHVSRDDEINSIVQKLLSHDNFVSLHAHRQAGKSSLLLPITESLEEGGHVVLNISLQGIGRDDNFWKSLCERIYIVHRVEGFEFHDAPGPEISIGQISEKICILFLTRLTSSCLYQRFVRISCRHCAGILAQLLGCNSR